MGLCATRILCAAAALSKLLSIFLNFPSLAVGHGLVRLAARLSRSAWRAPRMSPNKLEPASAQPAGVNILWVYARLVDSRPSHLRTITPPFRSSPHVSRSAIFCTQSYFLTAFSTHPLDFRSPSILTLPFPSGPSLGLCGKCSED